MKLTKTFLAQCAALALFVLVAAFWAVHAHDKGAEDIRTSDTTGVFYSIVMNAHVLRQDQPETKSLMRGVSDGLTSAWRSHDMAAMYQATFDAYVRSVYLATGDVMDAYKILVFPLNLIFLVGTYLVLLHLTERPLVSAGLSLLASMPIFLPLAGEHFGMGPVTLFSRRHLFTAFAPWIIWLFYRNHSSAAGLVTTFTLAGLVANLHASGILLIEILLVAYLLHAGFDRRQFGIAAAGFLAACATGSFAVGGLWAKVASFVQEMLASLIPSAAAATIKPIPEQLQYLFYPPHIYSHLPGWVVHGLSVGTTMIVLAPLAFRRKIARQTYAHLLFFAAVAIFAFLAASELKYWLVVAVTLRLAGARQEPDRVFELSHLLIIATFVVSFMGMLVVQWASLSTESMPLVFNQLRGVRFLGFLVFLWIAVLLRNLQWREAPRIARLFVIVAAILASFADVRIVVRDNFRVPAEHARTEDLMAAARWAKTNTESHSKFLIDSWAFGIVAERAVYLGDKSQRDDPWRDYVKHREAGPTALIQLASHQGMDYAIIERGSEMPQDVRLEYKNDHYAIARVGKQGFNY